MLDALTQQISEPSASTVVVIRHHLPDSHFTQAQMDQLAELMTRWREARDRGVELSADEQSRLEGLINAELLASANRTNEILNQLAQ